MLAKADSRLREMFISAMIAELALEEQKKVALFY